MHNQLFAMYPINNNYEQRYTKIHLRKLFFCAKNKIFSNN